MTVDECFAYIESFTNLERKPGTSMRPYRLDRMKALLRHFGNPEGSFRSIHVAGSKGKGSTAAFLTAILTEAGEKTGTFASPHVSSYKERITVDGEEVDDGTLVSLVEGIRSGLAAMPVDTLPGKETPTTFELLTLLAFLCYESLGCTWAVIETGIGGRLDATNVILPEASIITPIEHEHTEVLGYTIAKIAWEKAGIIKPGVPTYCGMVSAEAESVIRGVARRQKSVLYSLGDAVGTVNVDVDVCGTDVAARWRSGGESHFRLQMVGAFQADNALLAALVGRKILVDKLGYSPDEAETTTATALARMHLPGRMEIIRGAPSIVLDAAHTETSAKRLVETYTTIFPRPGVLIFGSVLGKNSSAMASLLAPLFNDIVISTPGTFKQSNPEEVFSDFLRINPNTRIEKTPAAALALARDLADPEGSILVTGSFYMVAEIRNLLVLSPARG